MSDTSRTDAFIAKEPRIFLANIGDREKESIEIMRQMERELAAAQARIDELMLEYSPNEMTVEQIANWQNRQAPASGQVMHSNREAIGYLQDLVQALNGAFISSWQSTAAWEKELNAANEFLNTAGSRHE